MFRMKMTKVGEESERVGNAHDHSHSRQQQPPEVDGAGGGGGGARTAGTKTGRSKRVQLADIKKPDRR